MKSVRLLLLVLSVTAALSAQSGKPVENYGKIPLAFEANQGQLDSQVKFFSRGMGYSLFLAPTEAVLALNRVSQEKNAGVLRLKLLGANTNVHILGQDDLGGKSNYFIGKDPAKWRTNVPTFAKVKYEGIYSGIDLVYYGNQRQLEYDFIVSPGSDPRRIQFDVQGAKQIRNDGRGELVFLLGESEIRWHQPVVYQEKDGIRHLVAAHYTVANKNRVGFEVAEYDKGKPLYIDPLIYSTYLGGSLIDVGRGIAVDSGGNAYVTGQTFSTDFPAKNPMQQANSNGDIFVTKINPSGSALVYSIYLGGGAEDLGNAIAVDSTGNVYLTGYTFSTDFPTQHPILAANGGGQDAFAVKIDPTGTALVYSTYLGGSLNDVGNGIAVDSAGNAHITGATLSVDFPVTPAAFQQECSSDCYGGDAFVTKLNAAGSSFIYSTFLGGYIRDGGTAIAVDSADNAYVTGFAQCTGDTNPFPTTPGSFEPQCTGYARTDAFVTKFNPSGSSLIYSTFLGGIEDDTGYGIAVDVAGNAYVTGVASSPDFPTTPGSFQPLCGDSRACRNGDAFVSKLNPAGSALVYSSYLGGGSVEAGFGITLNAAGEAYVTGVTGSGSFPKENPDQKHYGGNDDVFVSRINSSGSKLLHSTFLGGSGTDYGYGIAVDNSGNAYVTGFVASANFPVTPGAFQTTCANCVQFADAFVTKVQALVRTTSSLTSAPNPSTHGEAVSFTATVTSSLGAPPDGETVTFMKGAKILGTGLLSGGSAGFTSATLPVGTNPVKAVYGGDSNFSGSTSNVIKQIVNKATK